MKQSSLLICFIIFASLAFFVLPAASEPVGGYNSYIELLPGGRPTQLANEEIISGAQAEIVRIEAIKRDRKIKFIRPIDIVRLNSTYSMISFEVSHTSKYSSRFSKNPAIFSLLFEGNDPSGLKRYAKNYIKWVGPSDIEQYNKSTTSKFCEIFIRSGVEDCVFEPKKVAEKKKDRTKSLRDKIKKLEKSATRQSLHAQKLEETIAQYHLQAQQLEESTAQQQLQAQQLEETITQQRLQTKQLEEAIAQQRLQAQQLQEKMAQQLLQTQKLETMVSALQALLKGVSRGKNEILFSGINLHIVNGTGSTHDNVNGTGNLIVGYNEKKPGEPLQMESHEIISPAKTNSVEIETATEEKTTPPVKLVEEVESKLSGVCFIDTARF